MMLTANQQNSGAATSTAAEGEGDVQRCAISGDAAQQQRDHERTLPGMEHSSARNWHSSPGLEDRQRGPAWRLRLTESGEATMNRTQSSDAQLLHSHSLTSRAQLAAPSGVYSWWGRTLRQACTREGLQRRHSPGLTSFLAFPCVCTALPHNTHRNCLPDAAACTPL